VYIYIYIYIYNKIAIKNQEKIKDRNKRQFHMNFHLKDGLGMEFIAYLTVK